MAVRSCTTLRTGRHPGSFTTSLDAAAAADQCEYVYRATPGPAPGDSEHAYHGRWFWPGQGGN